MGEIRDECGYDLLQAMNTGHGGTLSTLHADSALMLWTGWQIWRSAHEPISTSNSSVTDRKGSGFCSLLRTRFHGPTPGARADYREWIQHTDQCFVTEKSTGLPPRQRHEIKRGLHGWNANRRSGDAKPSWHGEANGITPCCALLSVTTPSGRHAMPGARCGSLSEV